MTRVNHYALSKAVGFLPQGKLTGWVRINIDIVRIVISRLSM